LENGIVARNPKARRRCVHQSPWWSDSRFELDQKSGYADRPDQQKLQEVVTVRGKPSRPEEVPAHQGDENSREKDKPERIGEEFEGDVEFSVQNTDTEVVLDRNETGGEKQDEESGVDGEMGQPADLPLEHLLLPQTDLQDIHRPVPQIVQPVLPFRPASLVRPDPFVQPPGENDDHNA
jgi:hypothetical protein